MKNAFVRAARFASDALVRALPAATPPAAARLATPRLAALAAAKTIAAPETASDRRLVLPAGAQTGTTDHSPGDATYPKTD
jgi:hypothetical protein